MCNIFFSFVRDFDHSLYFMYIFEVSEHTEIAFDRVNIEASFEVSTYNG